MTQTRWIRRAAICGVLVFPILATGCGLISQGTKGEIDPPQQSESVDGTNTGQAVLPGQADDSNLTVYLEDRNGYLAPVSLNTALDQNDIAVAGKKALELMVDGGSLANQLPEDFRAVLPKGTEVKSLQLDPKSQIATVEFGGTFTDYPATDERTIVEAITWTLTALGAKGVEVWYDGAKLPEMPQDGFPLDEPLTRAVGINLEAADGVNYLNSTPVTLYFSSTTSNDEQYYVPVTRLINRTDESSAKAAMEQLIDGPLKAKDLTAVLTNDVEVTSINQKEDTVTVDLKDQAFEEGLPAPAEMLEAIVLSITENTGAAQVQITLNGQNVTDENNVDYSKPVSRPHHVNAIKS
ncbi:GerMN domain-containing protein [Paenibacillus glycanilyticus]|uniref:Sporulation protein n=1 Tax=Paenibacillus glycanilyticus TaxID=126569 RepID=A0ABQ6GFE4_9BACL|nr:GerMN domain-containing protein [Paenibacillus glycanilyticus]GLX69568.1 sporulation protein [Paenibacillus glycanilyticus]